MSRPGHTGEPSMEDILASIRKIVAEEPGTPSRPVPDRSAEVFAPPKNANPLPASGAAAAAGRPGGLPLNDLTEALNATFGSAKRPPEDDLSDILEDAPALPKSNGEATQVSLTNRLEEVEPEAKKAAVAQNGSGEKPTPAPVSPSWSHSRVSFKPSGGDATSAEASSSTPVVEKTVETTSSLGDVRPQSSFPASMSVRSFKAAFPPGTSTPRSEPFKSFRVEPSRPLGDDSQAAPNGSVKLAESSAPSFGAGLTRQSDDAQATAASAKSETAGIGTTRPETAVKSEAIKSEPEVIAAMPASVETASAPHSGDAGKTAADTPLSSPDGVNAMNSGAERAVREPDTADVSQVRPTNGAQPFSLPPGERMAMPAPEPSPQTASPANGSRPAYDGGYETATAKAAVSALDALAAGLAASTSGAAPSGAATPPPIVEAVPYNGMLTDRAVALRTEPPAAPHAKTMEDTVTELLKPMLREWLSENMPRMLEKALRSEAADDNKRSG